MMGELRQLFAVIQDLVARLEIVALRTTETADLYRGLFVNHVLLSGSVTIPASGVWSESFGAPYASVAVYNPATSALTVTNAPPAGSAPASGRGVCNVPPATYAERNISGRDVTIYGPAGTVVDVEVLTRPTVGR